MEQYCFFYAVTHLTYFSVYTGIRLILPQKFLCLSAVHGGTLDSLLTCSHQYFTC